MTNEHTVSLRVDGWSCTCGTRKDGLRADLFTADRLLRNASAETHAFEMQGLLEFGGVKV